MTIPSSRAKIAAAKRVKSTKNEYLTKLSELRKSLKQAVLKRSEEVDEDLLFLGTLNSDTLAESQKFFADISQMEQQHWRQTVHSHEHMHAVQPTNNLDVESVERRAQEALEQATLMVDDARQSMAPTDRVAVDITLNSNTTQYLKSQLKQLDERSLPLLNEYSVELSDTMDRCLQRATDAVNRKHGNFNQVVKSNASLAAVSDRIEELRAMTQSFSRQQETLREKLFDQHEEAVGRASAAILQRRLLFLNRIKDKFDTLQVMSRESSQVRQKPPPPPPPPSSGRSSVSIQQQQQQQAGSRGFR
eukprot:gene28538-35415_t